MNPKNKAVLLAGNTAQCVAFLQRHFTVNQHDGATICPGARNTQDVAVATPTESGVLFCPEFADTAPFRIRHGYGQDGRIGNNRRTATSVFRTSCHPPCDRRKLHGVFKSHVGAIMATSQSASTGASPTTHHDHTSLSFVKVESKGPRNQKITNCFSVPDQFAAQHSNHAVYLPARAQRSEDWAKESALREAERNRQTGLRLAAARKAKRAARMAGSEVAQ